MTTTSFRFTILGPVVPKQRPRLGRKGNVYTPPETVAYEQRVKLHAIGAAAKSGYRLGDAVGPHFAGSHFAVTLRIFCQDARRRDLDNAAKGVLDALNGLAWADDSQIHEMHLFKAVDRASPRVEVAIERRTTEAA